MTKSEKDIWFSPMNAAEANAAPVKNVKLKHSEPMTTDAWMELPAEEREGLWMGSYWIRVKIDTLTEKITPVFLSDQPRNYLTKAIKG